MRFSAVFRESLRLFEAASFFAFFCKKDIADNLSRFFIGSLPKKSGRPVLFIREADLEGERPPEHFRADPNNSILISYNTSLNYKL